MKQTTCHHNKRRCILQCFGFVSAKFGPIVQLRQLLLMRVFARKSSSPTTTTTTAPLFPKISVWFLRKIRIERQRSANHYYSGEKREGKNWKKRNPSFLLLLLITSFTNNIVAQNSKNASFLDFMTITRSHSHFSLANLI